jgi:hypothetical protein
MPQQQQSNSTFQEGRLLLAIQAIQTGQISSVRKAALTYDVARSTLQARLHGRVAQPDYRPISHKLTTVEESVLI